MVTPTVFIGSSTEQLKAAVALKSCVSAFAHATLWNESMAFGVNESVFDKLLEASERFDFAVFIFSPDDVAVIRKSETRIVRDNVVFELGLFTGRLGKARAFWISPRTTNTDSAPREHLPSDLEGITHLSFDRPSADGRMEEALRPACEWLQTHITKLGARTDRPVEELQDPRILCVASSAYSAPKFAKDIKEIQQNFPTGSIEHAHGVNIAGLWNYFSTGRRWDIVHLAMYVDPLDGRLIVPSGEPRRHFPWWRKERPDVVSIEGVEEMIRKSGARLVVVVTCDSLVLAARIARRVNTIAGHKAIDVGDALSWSAVFYRSLAQGSPLSEAFNDAQAMVDPGLMLLVKRDFKLRLAVGSAPAS